MWRKRGFFCVNPYNEHLFKRRKSYYFLIWGGGRFAFLLQLFSSFPLKKDRAFVHAIIRCFVFL